MSNLAVQDKNLPVTTQVLLSIQGQMGNGSIRLPDDYVVENALRNAWIWIQNSDKKDDLLNCTIASQKAALNDMVLQCGDVAKGTGYLIAYKDKMTYQRHYNGDMALAERVRPGIQGYSDVVYEGEVFKVVKLRSRYGFITVVERHEMLEARKGNITHAYCGFVDANGESLGDEVMTIEQILKSWEKSKTFDPKTMKGRYGVTFHTEQPDIACKRTVIRRRCKPIITKSTDAWLVAAVIRQDIDETAAEMDAEVEAKANRQLITMPTGTQLEGKYSGVVLDETTSVENGPPSHSIDADQPNPEPQREEEPAATEETETPPAEAPVQPAAEPEAPVTTNTQEQEKPAGAATTRLSLTKEQSDELKALMPPGGSYVLLKAAAEKDGVTTFEDFKARIVALTAEAGEPGY